MTTVERWILIWAGRLYPIYIGLFIGCLVALFARAVAPRSTVPNWVYLAICGGLGTAVFVVITLVQRHVDKAVRGFRDGVEEMIAALSEEEVLDKISQMAQSSLVVHVLPRTAASTLPRGLPVSVQQFFTRFEAVRVCFSPEADPRTGIYLHRGMIARHNDRLWRVGQFNETEAVCVDRITEEALNLSDAEQLPPIDHSHALVNKKIMTLGRVVLYNALIIQRSREIDEERDRMLAESSS